MKSVLRLSDNRSALFHALIYGAGTVMMQAAGIVLLPLYTHYLSPADFGAIDILSRAGQLIMIALMVNGIGTATFTFYCQAKSDKERQDVASTLFLFLQVIVVSACGLLVLLAAPLSWMLAIDDIFLTVFGLLMIVCEANVAFPLALMQARQESMHFVLASLAILVCRVTLAVVCVCYLGLGIWGVIIASLATTVVFGTLLNFRELAAGFSPQRRLLPPIWRFTLPFLLSGICAFIASSGDRFILLHLSGAAQVGIYALGWKLGSAVGMFSFMPLFKVWSAKVYDEFERADAATRVGRAFSGMLAVYIFAGLVMCVLARHAIEILAPPEYLDASYIVYPVVLSQLFVYSGYLADGAIYVTHSTSVKGWISLLSMILALGLFVILIPRFGALGAAYASAAGAFLHAAITVAWAQRLRRVDYQYPKLATMVALAVVVVAVAQRFDTSPFALAIKILLIAAWPLAMWLSGALDDYDKRQISLIATRVRQTLIRRHKLTADA